MHREMDTLRYTTICIQITYYWYATGRYRTLHIQVVRAQNHSILKITEVIYAILSFWTYGTYLFIHQTFDNITINTPLACLSTSSHLLPLCMFNKFHRQCGPVGWMLVYHRDGLSSSSFSLILDNSVSLSAGTQSAGDSVPETLVRILHSAEEDNLSPFDSKIACARASKSITANIHIARARCESQPAVGSSGLNARWS